MYLSEIAEIIDRNVRTIEPEVHLRRVMLFFTRYHVTGSIFATSSGRR